jgi:hypothetical protein
LQESEDENMKTTTAITLSPAAQLNVEETGCDPLDDLAALRDGRHTAASLLALCLDGADEDRVTGWREYVDALALRAEAVQS